MEDSVQTLIASGKYHEALDLVTQFDRLRELYYKIVIYTEMFHYKTSRALLDEALEVARKENDSTIISRLYLYGSLNCVLTNEYDRAQELLEQYSALESNLKENSDFTKALEELISGIFVYEKGDDEKARKLFNDAISKLKNYNYFGILARAHYYCVMVTENDRAINYIEEVVQFYKIKQNKWFEGTKSCLLGHYYQLRGNYTKARQLNTIALEIATAVKNEPGIASSNNCLGMIAIEEGKFREAIQRLEVANRIYSKYTNNKISAEYLIMAYRFAGLREKALEIASEALADIESKKLNLTNYSRLFIQLIQIALELNDLNLAKNYYSMLEAGFKNEKDDEEFDSLNLAKALLLRAEHSLASMQEAQTILRKITKKDSTVFHLRILAIKQLCEILLKEYELFEDPKVIENVVELVNNLTSIAEEQKLIKLSYEVGILQSKIDLAFGNIQQAEDRLLKLRERAHTNKLIYFEQRTSSEIANLEKDFQKWITLVENNASMKEMLKQAQIREYIMSAKKLNENI